MSSQSSASGWEHSRAALCGVCRSHLGKGCRAFKNFFTKIYAYEIHQSSQKTLQAKNLAFSWLVKRIFAKNLRVNDKKQQKQHLKSSYKAKNAQFVAHFSK